MGPFVSFTRWYKRKAESRKLKGLYTPLRYAPRPLSQGDKEGDCVLIRFLLSVSCGQSGD